MLAFWKRFVNGVSQKLRGMGVVDDDGKLSLVYNSADHCELSWINCRIANSPSSTSSPIQVCILMV
jgi:hypothetical protein